MSDVFSRASRGDVILRTGEPSDEQLAAINSRISREPLTAEQLYVVPAEMSNTLVDEYATWMAPSSLANFAAGANGGRGLPAMTHHHTWGTFAAGKWFAAVIEERASAPKRPKGAPLLARDVFGRYTGAEQRLVETAFLRRNERNEELIDGLESGVTDSVSIGATVNAMRAPGSDLICDITNLSLFGRGSDERSPYFPGVVYEIDGQPVLATARYERAIQREGSFVAIPGNSESLVQRAADLLREGQLPSEDAERLADVFGAALFPAKIYSIGETVRVGGAPSPSDEPSREAGDDTDAATEGSPTNRSETMAENASALDAVRGFLGDDLAGDLEAYRAEGRSEWEMAARLQADELKRAAEANAEAERKASEQDALVRRALGLEPSEDLATGFARVEQERAYGREARTALMDRWEEAFVRAHDIEADGFDRAGEEALRAGWTTAQVEAEIKRLNKLAGRTLTAGTTSERSVDDPTSDDETTETPKRQQRLNPLLMGA